MKKAILLLAPLVVVAAAQSIEPTKPSPTPQTEVLPPISESARVDITSVDVVVTDSKGNRVTGLTKDDFAITQDGLPQPISNFYGVDGAKVTFEDGKTLDLGTKEAVDQAPPLVQTRYVLYIDNLNIQPQNRNRMFGRLEEFVAQTVGPLAQAEVISYNRSLKIKQTFTSESGLIVGALEDIERQTGGGTTLVGDRRDAVQRINDSQSSDDALQIARTFARSTVNDIQFDVDAIKGVFEGLAGLAGRKVFVYVSEGLPAIAGAELYETIQTKFGGNASTLEQFDFNLNGKYASIIQAANAQGVTIWALDASGLATDTFTSAEYSGYQVRPNEFLMRQNAQAPIQMMAEETGGMASINTNDWKRSLDDLARDFTSFYSLGYRTGGVAVDKPHRIAVEIKRKGLKVRYRKGLVEKTVETRIADTVISALDYPRSDNPLGISARLDPSEPYRSNTYIVPVHIVLPIGKIGLLPSGDRYEGSYFIYAMVRDADGDKSDLQVRRESISVPAKELPRAQTKDQSYELKLVVRSGAQRLSLAIRDGATNQVSYFQKNFFVSILPPAKKS